MRPTEYLEKWSDRDRKLAEAEILRQDSLYCPCGCGQLKRLAHDSDTEGWWLTPTITCYARQALDAAADGDDKPEPGAMRFVYLDPDYSPERPDRVDS